MKVIVMSDSHGKKGVLDLVLANHPDADAYIHCGDIDEQAYEHPQLSTVKGNNDMFTDHPDHRILALGEHRIFIVHSHQFGYHNRMEKMADVAKQQNCDIVCFGHTHVAFDEVINGVRCINPGSLWRSRDGRGPSYASMELDTDVQVEFIFLPKQADEFFW